MAGCWALLSVSLGPPQGHGGLRHIARSRCNREARPTWLQSLLSPRQPWTGSTHAPQARPVSRDRTPGTSPNTRACVSLTRLHVAGQGLVATTATFPVCPMHLPHPCLSSKEPGPVSFYLQSPSSSPRALGSGWRPWGCHSRWRPGPAFPGTPRRTGPPNGGLATASQWCQGERRSDSHAPP